MNKKLYTQKEQRKKIEQFVYQIKNDRNKRSFGEVMEKLYAQDKLFFDSSKNTNIINLSSGTSRIKTFPPYLTFLTKDLKRHAFYREYFAPSGSASLRTSIALFENTKFKRNVFDLDNICLTEGATGGISSIFEYLKHSYPKGEIIIPTPSYYLFKLTAEHYQIKYKEVFSYSNKEKCFIDIKDILKAVNKNTKLIIIVNPNNPTGEIYSDEELNNLIQIAKKRDIFILSDEVFSDLSTENGNKIKGTDFIAEQYNYLTKTFVVKSLSKNRNLPGLRIGYVYSKNKEAIKYIGKIQEERVFFAPASNFKTILMYDNLLQTIEKEQNSNPKQKLTTCISFILKKYQASGLFLTEKTSAIEKLYNEFTSYMKIVNSTYDTYFKYGIEKFGKHIEDVSNRQSNFNVFIKIRGLNNVNVFDFCLNLYLFAGIKIEAAPYFGLTQREWEKKGFWMRFTFAQEKKVMSIGIKRLIDFKNEYLKKPHYFIQTNLQF